MSQMNKFILSMDTNKYTRAGTGGGGTGRISSVKYIVIHCSADSDTNGKNYDIGTIAESHLDARFGTIGYHYIITMDGRIQKGRNDVMIGQQASGLNAISLGVCYIGGYTGPINSKTGAGTNCDTRTNAQKQSMLLLVYLLKRIYPEAAVIGHNNVPGAGKTCPNFNAIKEFDWMNRGAPPSREHEQLFQSAGVDWRRPYELRNIEDWGLQNAKTSGKDEKERRNRKEYAKAARAGKYPKSGETLGKARLNEKIQNSGSNWGNTFTDLTGNIAHNLATRYIEQYDKEKKAGTKSGNSWGVSRDRITFHNYQEMFNAHNKAGGIAYSIHRNIGSSDIYGHRVYNGSGSGGSVYYASAPSSFTNGSNNWSVPKHFGNGTASGGGYAFSLSPGNYDKDPLYLQLVRKA